MRAQEESNARVSLLRKYKQGHEQTEISHKKMLKQINVNSFDSPQAGTTILSPNASTSVGAVAVSDLKKEFSKAQL